MTLFFISFNTPNINDFIIYNFLYILTSSLFFLFKQVIDHIYLSFRAMQCKCVCNKPNVAGSAYAAITNF